MKIWTDVYVEKLIGKLLQFGVILSSTIVFVGGIIYLTRHGRAAPQYHVFTGEPGDLRTVPGIALYALKRQGRGIIQLGLLLLIATPVARVAFSVGAFALERDRLYVVITLIVLAILLASFISGQA